MGIKAEFVGHRRQSIVKFRPIAPGACVPVGASRARNVRVGRQFPDEFWRWFGESFKYLGALGQESGGASVLRLKK